MAESRRRVEAFFAAWARGEANFADLLAEDVTWTITGTCPISRTYSSRHDFLENAVGEVSARLSEQIRPQVRSVVSEGDTVVVLWDGKATAKDGQAYDNTYCWIMELENGKVARATAFFDTIVRSYDSDAARKGAGWVSTS